MSWSRQSKALVKSMKMEVGVSFLSSDVMIWSVNSISACSVECFLRNPYWLL